MTYNTRAIISETRSYISRFRRCRWNHCLSSLLACHSGSTSEDFNFFENIILLHKRFCVNSPSFSWLQVTVVVNYDMPIDTSGKPDFETYLHRIGRTGRFGKNGIAVNFIDGQRSMNIMKKIQEHFGKKISLLETNDVEELEKLTWDSCYVKHFFGLFSFLFFSTKGGVALVLVACLYKV